MMQKRNRYYWLLQLSGWGLLALMFVLVYEFSDQRVDARLIEQLAVLIFSGILTTHLFRSFIHRSNWLLLPVEKAAPKFLMAVVILCLVAALIRISIIQWLDLSSRNRKFEFFTRFLFFALENGVFFIPWTLIYYFYHYIGKSRNQQLDTLKLEALVKELELKTIKSHINPHFIFNALNSIRALIDENPARARKAITELSNILRSSMQAEKLETVSFEKELNIVKDYLALEHIRFEDRLQVKYFIDDETLDQQIPPMMLQTLVENAIKHGISKQVSGGTVTIISDLKENYHELVIRNTGKLAGSNNSDGFGLASTRDRLYLLFGKNANFNIQEIDGDTVEATLQIPFDAINK